MQLIYGVVFALIVIILLYVRERSWNKLLQAKSQEIISLENQLNSTKGLLSIEQDHNRKTQEFLLSISERCFSNDEGSSIQVDGTATVDASVCVSELFAEYKNTLVVENLNVDRIANQTRLDSILLFENHKISFVSRNLFDKTGLCVLCLFLSIIISEFMSVYNIWEQKTEVIINDKVYDKFDFIDRNLFQQVQLFLIKEHPLTTFYFFTVVLFVLFVVYLQSWVFGFTNFAYYQFFGMLIKVLILFYLSKFLGFFIFNIRQLLVYFRKYYPNESILQIILGQYKKLDFWVLILHKVFYVYDFYQAIVLLLWFLNIGFQVLPLLYFFYCYDTIYTHENMSDTSKLNSVNLFMLISWLHSLGPLVIQAYFHVLTIILPFLRISTTNDSSKSGVDFIISPYEQILFSSGKQNILLSILKKLIGFKIFLDDEVPNPAYSASSADTPKFKINDTKVGVIVFFGLLNSGIYLLRFFYFIFFHKISTTWFSWIMLWYYVLFHVLVILYTLPVINILLTKYELIKRYRESFKFTTTEKILQMWKELKSKDSVDSSNGDQNEESENSLKEDALLEEEIAVSLNIFDFSLHKSVLYRLFLHDNSEPDPKPQDSEENEKDDKDAKRLNRIFQSILKADAVTFGTKFKEQDESDSESEGKL